MFVNLSHHPSSNWNPRQREEALHLGAGSIHDETFPEVPPDADTEQVHAMAAELAARVAALNPAAAMVQGEMTLAFRLVTLLDARKIPCYAATTRRIVRDLVVDGRPQTVKTFEFVRFRRY